MSVVIAKKADNKFIVGCDTQVTSGQTRGNVTKIFHYKNNPEIVCGVVGSLRDLNIFSTMENILEETSVRRELVDLDDVIMKTVNNLKSKLKEEGRLIMDKDSGEVMNSELMIAYKDKCYIVNQDFAVTEVDDFAAIGSPEFFALGAYEMIYDNESIDDKEKVLKIIKACIKKTIYVGYPIVMTDTSIKDMEIINS